MISFPGFAWERATARLLPRGLKLPEPVIHAVSMIREAEPRVQRVPRRSPFHSWDLCTLASRQLRHSLQQLHEHATTSV